MAKDTQRCLLSCWCALLCCCVFLLFCCYVGVLLCCCVAVVFCCCVVVLLCCCVVVLVCCCVVWYQSLVILLAIFLTAKEFQGNMQVFDKPVFVKQFCTCSSCHLCQSQSIIWHSTWVIVASTINQKRIPHRHTNPIGFVITFGIDM